MCFTIPYQVKQIKHNTAILEDGRSIPLLPHLKVSVGEYLQLKGDYPVGVLSEQEGKEVRSLIQSLNKSIGEE